MEESKITIIEGPTPTFEVVYDSWPYGIIDSSTQAAVAMTRLRTANGNALVERCYRAWHHHNPINLEFRATDGLTQELPIVAARATNTDEGDLLLLWVRLPEADLVVDFVDEGEDFEEDFDEEFSDDFEDDDYDDYDEYDDDDYDEYDDDDNDNQGLEF